MLIVRFAFGVGLWCQTRQRPRSVRMSFCCRNVSTVSGAGRRHGIPTSVLVHAPFRLPSRNRIYRSPAGSWKEDERGIEDLRMQPIGEQFVMNLLY